MKRLLLPSIMMLASSGAIFSQSAVDALQLTQGDFRGTARFMSMGGAFTALGGDLSTLTQNPAGIGIYRHSEIGATLNIDIQSTKGESLSNTINNDQTKVACNNFGYVGVANPGGPMETFQWGVTYGRAVSFDRKYSGYLVPTATSLSNYIASFSNGYSPEVLDFGQNYNPYRDSDADWLSILGYAGYLINPLNGTNNQYKGLYQKGTVGDALLHVREKGYIDEYSFNFGGNFSNLVYWGLGIGVTDLSYTRITEYSESMENAAIPNLRSGDVGGDAGFTLSNYKHITGTGWNVKFGLIVKPINEFRIGAAIHSPTWYSLDHNYDATIGYSYYNPAIAQDRENPLEGEEYTDVASFSWRLRSPWKFMIGAAAVVGGRFILSADYEYQAYPDMTVKNANYDGYGYLNDYVNNEVVNNDIKSYTQNGNTVRVGAEYRVTPKFSVRAGYNVTLSNIKKDVREGATEVITSGTDPSYSFDKTRNNISVGLGYRFGAFSLDAAYVHSSRESTLKPYTNFGDNMSPSYKIKDNNNNIVLSLGFKF